MSVQSHDVLPQGELLCEEVAQGPRTTLLCWLTPGHPGDHWDHVDKIHWSANPDLVITACTHETAETP